MAAFATLTGQWVDPSGAPRVGRIVVRRLDEERPGGGVTVGADHASLVNGSLPVQDSDTAARLQVATPPAGSWAYQVTEQLADVDDVTYRIDVYPFDAATGIDLPNRSPDTA